VPRVSVAVTINKSTRDIGIISNYNTQSKSLDATYQYLISEVVMLRLFSILEDSISEIAFKLACGAIYTNGNAPIILIPCRSMLNAHNLMLSHNRTTPLRYHQWTKADLIKKSIKHVLSTSDSFYSNIQNHSALINEMRQVRNHIAHRTASTKTKYYSVLSSIYGGNPRLTTGAFLTSTSRHTLSNIDRYISSTQIILNDITKG
jgi:hypothetical protein